MNSEYTKKFIERKERMEEKKAIWEENEIIVKLEKDKNGYFAICPICKTKHELNIGKDEYPHLKRKSPLCNHYVMADWSYCMLVKFRKTAICAYCGKVTDVNEKPKPNYIFCNQKCQDASIKESEVEGILKNKDMPNSEIKKLGRIAHLIYN